jgi:hypothetical protein
MSGIFISRLAAAKPSSTSEKPSISISKTETNGLLRKAIFIIFPLKLSADNIYAHLQHYKARWQGGKATKTGPKFAWF